jgi:hypothetical protein
LIERGPAPARKRFTIISLERRDDRLTFLSKLEDMKGLILVLFAIALASPATDAATNRLVVHEWGTFTALQDERGRSLDGINTDDEPVPFFVHQLAGGSPVFSATQMPGFFSQGAPFAQPNVTMRLETPVIYFHPTGDLPRSVDVKVQFRGGLLTEFYPQPTREEPVIKLAERRTMFQRSNLGVLEWKGLKVGAAGKMMATDDPVWVAPRRVQAADVRTPPGESERFLFYRGLGTGEALLKVAQRDNELVIQPSVPPEIEGDLRIRRLWLVDIQKDKIAFREAPGFTIPHKSEGFSKRIPSQFTAADYSAANREKLRSALLDALQVEGLFEDEAAALLETWKISYFQSPGLRLFFVTPRAWTDQLLPLEIPQADKIVRAMIGRIELVSPRQRQLLAGINKASSAEIQSAATVLRERIGKKLYPANKELDKKAMENINLIFKGRKSLADLGIETPVIYKKYLELGRFRHTLVTHSAIDAPGLKVFLEAFRLIEPSRDAEAR